MLTTPRILGSILRNSNAKVSPLIQIPFLIVSVVLFASPIAISLLCMRRVGRALEKARGCESAISAMLLQSTRDFVLKNWLATILLSTLALAFFLHFCGVTGLVLWTLGFLPVLLTMMFTMLLLNMPPTPRQLF